MNETISNTQLKEEEWTQVISSETGLFDFNLKEVWKYRDLLFLFVRRDFVAKYKQTILGPIWHFIQPLLTTMVSFILFNMVANISTNGINPILFQMSGIIIWSYFATSITACSTVFISNANIFGKVYFPRLIMPLSIVISSLIQLGIQFLLLFSTIAYFYIKGEPQYVGTNLLFIPIYIVLMALLGLGLGIIISSVTTKYRDMSVLLTFGVQLLMYASAVNYPLSVLAERKPALYHLLKWNPLASLVDGFRNSILGGTINTSDLIYPTIFTFIALFLGIMMFNKVEKSFMDTV
ncbi:MAG: ABC transporter permease [Cytophagales bacterium]|nr:MAG: ABC transporter permease [Cytophagales bacterium]